MGSHRVDTTDSAAAADDDNYSPSSSRCREKNRYKYISGAAKPQIESFLVNSAQSSEHKYLRIYRTKPSLIAIPLILLPSDFLSIVFF